MIVLAGYLFEEKLYQSEKQQVENALISIGILKASEITAWMKERHADAEVLANDTLLINALYSLKTHGSGAETELIRQRLQEVKQVHGYQSVAFVNTEAEVLLSSLQSASLSTREKDLVDEAISLERIIFSDLHRQNIPGRDMIGFDIVIPLKKRVREQTRIFGAIFIRADAEQLIFPLIQTWPYPSRSAESLLVRQDDDQVVFLNDLRFHKNAALILKYPITEENLPGAVALRSFEGVMSGNDYRGVEVIASAHKVSGTDWALIAKVDKAEFYKPLMEIRTASTFIIIVLLIISFMIFYYWRQLFSQRLITQQYKLKSEKQALETHFDFLTRYANDIILLADNDWHILEVNEKAIESYQYPRDEIIGLLITELEVSETNQQREKAFTGSFNEGFIFEDMHERKDGSTFPVEISLRTIKKEGIKYRQLIIRNITERKQDEKKIRSYEHIISATGDQLSFIDRDYIYQAVNEAYLTYHQKERQEIVGHSSKDILGAAIFNQYAKQKLDRCFAGETIHYQEWFNFPRAGRRYMDIAYYPYVETDGTVTGVVVSSRDITDWKEMEDVLRENKQQLDTMTNSIQDAMIMLDNEGNVAFWNDAAEKLFDHKKKEVIGRPLIELIIPERYREDHLNGYKTFSETGQGPIIGQMVELYALHKDGTEFPIELSASSLLLHDKWHAVGIIHDITKRKQLEQKETSLGNIIRFSLNEIYIFDSETLKFIDVNTCARNNLGYTMEEFQELTPIDLKKEFTPETFRELINPLRSGVEEKIVFESTHERKDGTSYPVEVHLQLMPYLEKDAFVAFILDITERKKIERELKISMKAMSALSACNEALVRAKSEDAITKEVCNIITSKIGYQLAWVGYAEKDRNKTVRPVAQSGFDEGYLEQADIRWDDTPHGQGPSGRAIKNRHTIVRGDIQDDSMFEPWREAAILHGFRSVIAIPLKLEDDIFGTLTIYAEETFAFSQEAVALLQEMADDLAYGINALRTQVEKKAYSNQMQESLISTIEAIAMTVEKRDPYTAGHMQRVAQLSVVIAKELGLSEEQVKGIDLGASIHDIGKIYIPAEILNRPGKLTAAEFEIIKSHTQVGYDIIKGVNFPWPVAEMILQHHERLDGTGYPNGLKGDEIKYEAQILAVADVVEAVSAHRPYRAALGIEKALEVIRQGKGTHFNPDIVDTCIKIIEQDKFEFTSSF
ncbi:MAG: PAS domain S-box protein [Gammaproteobacteria bacterium]